MKNWINLREAVKGILRVVLPLKVYKLAAKIKNNAFLNLKKTIQNHPIALFGRYPGFLYPKTLAIFLTTRCNLRCFICRRENFKGEDIDFENIYKLKNAIKHASSIDITGWGEPFLYPRLNEVLDYIYSLNKNKNLIQITSNGTLLSKEKAALLNGHMKSLTISLNAATAETYNRDMQMGNFDKTIKHIKEFVAALDEADRGKVRLHLVAHTGNFREIPDFVSLAAELGVPAVTVGQYLVGIYEHEAYSIFTVKDDYNAAIEKASALAKKLGVQLNARRFNSEKSSVKQECMEPFESCYIGVDGSVGPCCYCGSYRVGNAYETGFESVWFSGEYGKLRKNRYLSVCKTCVPFISLDDPKAHYTAYLKEKEGPV